MKINLRTGAVIAAALVVVVIGLLMFASAAQPMSDEGAVAQSWVDDFCANRMDDLYSLSALPANFDKDTFRGEVDNYLTSSGIPQPCVGQVNYNLIRDLAVPASLTKQVDRVRYFGEVTLAGTTDNRSATLALWLYHNITGGWRVWASFLGTTPEQPVAAGSVGSIFDTNGLIVGTVQIKPPATLYQADNRVLIGVPVDLQTLAHPWEQYNAQLFVDQQRADAISDVTQLLEEWQAGFLVPSGGYTPQNLHETGTLWFSASAVPKQMNLAFTVQAPYSGTLQAVYLDVPAATAVQLTPFNPFKNMHFVQIAQSNPVFELTMDMTGLTAAQFTVDCNRFVLVLVTGEWKRGTDCTFPQGGSQTYLPNEQATVQVTFAGYNLDSEAQLKSIMYRRGDNTQIIRYALWQPDSGAGG